MGRYINIGNDSFRNVRNSEYVDKTPLIDYVYRVLNTEQKLLAYIAAHKDYVFVRESPAGKGFDDIVLVPRRNVHYPAVVLELKCDKSAQTAISQIKHNCYCDSLLSYTGEVVLVGINYNKKTKQHTCRIERISNTKSNTCMAINDTVSNTKSNTYLTPKQQEVLSFCGNTPHTAKEIFDHLGISKQAKHYVVYVENLLQTGNLIDTTLDRQCNKRYLCRKK